VRRRPRILLSYLRRPDLRLPRLRVLDRLPALRQNLHPRPREVRGAPQLVAPKGLFADSANTRFHVGKFAPVITWKAFLWSLLFTYANVVWGAKITLCEDTWNT